MNGDWATDDRTAMPRTSHRPHHTNTKVITMARQKRGKPKYRRAPGAPKRFKSAFIFFSERQHKVIRHQSADKKIRAADVAKVVSRQWKAMGDTDRQYWIDMAVRDRERFEREKAVYTGPWKMLDVKDGESAEAPKTPSAAILLSTTTSNEGRGDSSQANLHFSKRGISHVAMSEGQSRQVLEQTALKKARSQWERQLSMLVAPKSGRSATDLPLVSTNISSSPLLALPPQSLLQVCSGSDGGGDASSCTYMYQPTLPSLFVPPHQAADSTHDVDELELLGDMELDALASDEDDEEEHPSSGAGRSIAAECAPGPAHTALSGTAMPLPHGPPTTPEENPERLALLAEELGDSGVQMFIAAFR